MAQERKQDDHACRTLEEHVMHTTLQTRSWLEELLITGEEGGGIHARSDSFSGTAFTAKMSEPAKMSVSEAQTDDSESETILKEYSDGLGWDGPRTKLRHLESIHK